MDQKLINVDNFAIGGDQTYIIAEVGSNHCQDLNLAKEHIAAAYETGANAVKFQSLNVHEQYFNPSERIKELHSKIDFQENWHAELYSYSKKKGITFFSSPTYFKAVDIMEEIGLPIYKLASAQIGTFPQIIRKVAQTGKPVILSTGLVGYGELERAIRIFEEEKNNQYIILHCNSIYPTPFEEVGLNIMDTYRKMFGCIVGFSDHTDGIAVPIGAVAMGAKVIEKHFTLDVKLPSPDAPSALEPDGFRGLVTAIRAVEKSVSDKYRINLHPQEAAFKDNILCKLILAKDKNAGEPILESDFDFKRTLGGIDCRDISAVIGKSYRFSIKKDTVLEWNHI